MSRTKKDCSDIVRDQLEMLKEIPPGITPSEGDIEYGPHTAIKLIFLNYYLGIYLPIANKRCRGKKIFIDAFGGTGLVKVKIKENEYVNLRGSSLCAALANKDRPNYGVFDEIYSFELDRRRWHLLKKRFDAIQSYVTPRLNPIYGDVNEKIMDLDIDAEDFVLLFIDPEGLEPNLLKFILFALRSKHIDIIMNISSGVRRVHGRASIDSACRERLRTFLPNYNENRSIEETINELFVKYFEKPYEVSVPVYSSGRKEVYTLTLRVRKTMSGTPWLRGMERLVECLNKLDGKKIKYMLLTRPVTDYFK